jgi:UDP-N-acetylmuramoylalanine--D-glutamate ligase
MYALKEKLVLVVGLSKAGRAACRLLRERGARVIAIDRFDIPDLQTEAEALRKIGVDVHLGVIDAPAQPFDLAVVSPEIGQNSSVIRTLKQRDVPIIGELELGYQQSLCLNVAISGTNGKTSVGDLISQVLEHCHRKTMFVGSCGAPICDVVGKTRELDFLTIEASAFQLERIQYFRPTIAVLLNIAHDHTDRYPSHPDYIRAKARLFMNQQPFDWAVVQSEAWAQMRSLDLPMPGKVITFSAQNRRADIFLDRSLIVSRLDGWAGHLLNMENCQLRGPHHAENFMAALAVGRILRLPLEEMAEVLRGARSLPHRCEFIAEIDGVKFINDSKSLNLESLRSAILSVPTEREPNIWLIAGGKDQGIDYHDLGPLLSQRVKGTFLIGEMREKLRAAWGLFTPCVLADSLLEAMSQGAEKAVPGDIILLSPACSSFDQFQNYQHRGELFRKAVDGLVRTRSSASAKSEHNKKEELGSAKMARTEKT